MRNIFHIFRREYLERVRSKAFIILTILAPVLLAGIIGVPILLATRSSKVQKVAIVDLDGRLGPLLERRLTERTPSPSDPAEAMKMATSERQQMRFVEDRYQVERVKVEPGQETAVRTRLSAQIKQSRLDAYLWMDAASLETGRVDYYARNLTDIAGIERMQRAVSAAITHLRLVNQGVASDKVQSLLRPVRLRTVRVSEQGEKEDRGLGAFVVSFFFTMVLYTTLIFYGVAVMRSIIEEKTSRIFEVLLSSVRPMELMAGKILGVAAVGLTQYLIWAVMFGLLGGVAGAVTMSSQWGNLSVAPSVLVYFVVYFMLGYLLYSAMFAALGAAVNNEQEAQQLQILVVQFLILPLLLQQMVLRNPASSWSVGLSLVPFFAPMLMFLRITVQTPPFWQIALSLVLMAGTIVVVMWACSRIYRIGILMYGKRPTLPELWRWMRTA